VTGFSLSRRDRRALLAGAAVVLVALAIHAAVRPALESYADTRERIASQRQLLARELGLLAQAPSYGTFFDRSEEALRGSAATLFGGAEEATATARLATYVGEHARLSGLLLEQSEAGAGELLQEGVLALSLQVRVAGDLEGVLALLRRLETGPKLVRVERLLIERSERFAGAANREVVVMSARLRGYSMRSVGHAAPPGDSVTLGDHD
jgi:hypothetical protein